MKIHIEIDIEPEELRRLYGVPDIAKLQGLVFDELKDKLSSADVDSLTQFIKPMMAEGMKAFDSYQKLLGGIIKFVPHAMADKVKSDAEPTEKPKKTGTKSKAKRSSSA